MKASSKVKEDIKTIAVCIAVTAIIIFGTVYFFMMKPLWQKTITSGQYEDIYIGQSKIDILKQLKSYSYRSQTQRIKAINQDNYLDINKITPAEESALVGSNVWKTNIIGLKSCYGASTKLEFTSDLLSEITVKCYNHK